MRSTVIEYTTRNIAFLSDNTAPSWLVGVSASSDFDLPYGDDRFRDALQQQISGLLGRECRVFPVSSGCAANIVALSGAAAVCDVLVCHERSHLASSENGAPVRLSGLRPVVLSADSQKLTTTQVREALHANVCRSLLSLTHATECGTLYSIEELLKFSECAKSFGALIHVDGARIANALAAANMPFSEFVCAAGVDTMCFGASKNGGLLAEAVIVLNERLFAPTVSAWAMNGHRSAKCHVLSRELLHYLRDDRWLEMAKRANSAARFLADRLHEQIGLTPVADVETNSVFIVPSDRQIAALRNAGYVFNYLPWISERCIRLMTNWSTNDAEVEALVATFANVE
jgi:threonine aldolase